jgi:hypothetical protein
MYKNLDSPHPLTPSPKDGRRGTRISPLSQRCYGLHTSRITPLNPPLERRETRESSSLPL